MNKIIVSLILITSCQLPTNNVKQAEKSNTGLKLLSAQITSNQNEVFVVDSYIYDSCKLTNSSSMTIGVRKQELLFKINNTLIARVENPITTLVYASAECSDSLRVQECSIYEIGFLEGTKSSVFSIRGSGLDNASAELFAFYDMKGRCIWLRYSNPQKSYKSLGNYDQTCKQIGLDTSEFLLGHYRKVQSHL